MAEIFLARHLIMQMGGEPAWCNGIQHNETKHNDIQHSRTKRNDILHNDTQHESQHMNRV